MSERAFYVLAYDISDDKRRAKIAKMCASVAERVQGSVFEGYFSEAELAALLKRVERFFDAEEDSLRVYNLCAECLEKVKAYGEGKVTPPPDVIII
jgi:CRISPR-associated protein Cas2